MVTNHLETPMINYDSLYNEAVELASLIINSNDWKERHGLIMRFNSDYYSYLKGSFYGDYPDKIQNLAAYISKNVKDLKRSQ